MSYNGIGLPTPRGTGTSGHIQKNSSSINPSTQTSRGVYSRRQDRQTRERERDVRFHRSNYAERKVDQDILAHERKRAIEVECLTLRDELEDKEGITPDEIERRVEELRNRLKTKMQEEEDLVDITKGQFKSHQVHEIVRAKELENERFRKDVLRNTGRRYSRESRERSLSPPRESLPRRQRERSPSSERRKRRESMSERSPVQYRRRSRSPGYDENRSRGGKRRSSVYSRSSISPEPRSDRKQRDRSPRERRRRPSMSYSGVELDYS